MIKKLILSMVLAMIPALISPAFAVTLVGVDEDTFDQSSNDQAFSQLTITAEKDDEITVENGIVIIIPDGSAIQWDTEKNDKIMVTGVGADKLFTPVVPEFSDDMYRLTIKVKENFKKGDELIINGLVPRTYREEVSERFLQLDINGDGLSDAGNYNRFLVRSNDNSDFIPPHPVKEVKVNYNQDKKQVEFSWKNPTDYDYIKTIVSKKIDTADSEIYSNTGERAYDKGYIEGQKVRYEFFTNDKEGNISEKVIVQYPPEEPQSDTKDVEKVVKSEPKEVVKKQNPKPKIVDIEKKIEDKEKAELNRLLNYFKIRYQIKCLRTGMNPLDSNCLWSKINLVYAQQKLNKKVLKASITTNELRVISKRMRFSESRYKKYCIEANQPAKYCNVLKQSLDRAEFLVDKSEAE